MTVKQLAVILIAVWAITVFVIIGIQFGFGFEMTDQLKQDEQLSQICTFLNLGTPECYQIIGDLDSTYEPPQ